MAELTPMMKQYMQIKAQHQDCILFFRLGDFYEMFCEDAKLAANCVCFNVSVSVKSTGASGSPCKVNIGKTSSIVRAGVLKPRSGKGRYTTKDGIPVRESQSTKPLRMATSPAACVAAA